METLVTGLAFAEGPIALDDGSVLVCETLGGRLSRVAADGAVSVIADLGGGPNGAAIGPDGRCYVCNNGGFDEVDVNGMRMPSEAPLDTPPGSIQAVDLETGAFETLYSHCEKTPFWGPNDIVFDDAGGFWFTDFGRDRGRVRTRGSIYYAQVDGSSITEVVTPVDGANGIGISPDGKTLYVAMTYEAHLRAFALAGPGQLAKGKGGHDDGSWLVGRAGTGDFLDSLAVDGAGNICVASPGNGAMMVFPPEGGQPKRIPMPDPRTTNICFGGPDLQTAYITLGLTGSIAKMRWEVAGLKLHY